MKKLLLIIGLLSAIASAQTRMDASSQIAFKVTNDGTTGTTINQLAKINSSGNAINALTTDTSVPVFVVVGAAGTTGSAQLATGGVAICKFDASGGTTGHYVQVSASTAGTCHDAGSTIPTSGWIVGTLTTSPAANASGSVLLLQGFLPSSGGGSFTGGTLTSELIFAAATTGAASGNIPSGTAPTTPVAGDFWLDGNGFNFVQNTSTNGSFDVKSSSTGSASTSGFVRYTGDSNVAKYSENGGALQEIVGKTKTQTISNKTFDSTNTGFLPLIGCATLASGATTLGPVSSITGTKLLVAIYISGYAGGDAASLQFNGSGGTAYRYRWLTVASGATTFSAGLVAASTDRIKIGAATTTNSRNVDAVINNDSANTEKLVMFINGQFGTGNSATQSTVDIGNGAWVSAASTSITSISLISTSNMNAGSKFCVYQLVP